MPTDPLELARVEYRKLLGKLKEADGERMRLRWVIDSAVCVLNGDAFPEVLADHRLVALAKEAFGPASDLANENTRLRGAVRAALAWVESAAVPMSEERLRLLEELRSNL